MLPLPCHLPGLPVPLLRQAAAAPPLPASLLLWLSLSVDPFAFIESLSRGLTSECHVIWEAGEVEEALGIHNFEHNQWSDSGRQQQRSCPGLIECAVILFLVFGALAWVIQVYLAMDLLYGNVRCDGSVCEARRWRQQQPNSTGDVEDTGIANNSGRVEQLVEWLRRGLCHKACRAYDVDYNDTSCHYACSTCCSLEGLEHPDWVWFQPRRVYWWCHLTMCYGMFDCCHVCCWVGCRSCMLAKSGKIWENRACDSSSCVRARSVSEFLGYELWGL